MSRLLGELGFAVSERIRRAPCILHGGTNPSAFSWNENGRWHCFSCNRGGDRIALVRFVRRYGFRQAVSFLAELGGVRYAPERVSRIAVAETRQTRARAEAAAWRVHDELARQRQYYTNSLHRADRLCSRIGKGIPRATTVKEQELGWSLLAQIAPAQTFFLAAWNFYTNAPLDTLIQGTSVTAAERRNIISKWDPKR
jgi:phage/plasmid primase-like uncharacterized protein